MAKNTTTPTFRLLDPEEQIPARRGGGRRSEFVDQIVEAAASNPGRAIELLDQSSGLASTLKKRSGISVTGRGTGTKGRTNLYVTYNHGDV